MLTKNLLCVMCFTLRKSVLMFSNIMQEFLKGALSNSVLQDS